jgi:hypothetical protein
LALDQEENILDDAELYSYGDDWAAILEVLPEFFFERLKEYVISTEVDCNTALRTHLGHELRLRESHQHCIVSQPPTAQEQDASLSGGDLGEDKFLDAVRELHYDATMMYIFVADKEAIETGEVAVLFIDDCGRVVRHKRMPPVDCESLSGGWLEASPHDVYEFTDGEIGPAYSRGGIYGPPFIAYDARALEAERETKAALDLR